MRQDGELERHRDERPDDLPRGQVVAVRLAEVAAHDLAASSRTYCAQTGLSMPSSFRMACFSAGFT